MPGMSLQPNELINHCIQILNTYNPDLLSTEQHLDLYLDENGIFDGNDQGFVDEVFCGCVSYKQVLSVVLNGFYATDGKKALRSEYNVYAVICYLTLFQLDQLNLGHYRRLIKTQDIKKIYKFLNFLCDEKKLITWMHDEWVKIYDETYVQTTFVSPFQRWIPELQEVVSEMEDKINNKVKSKKKVTIATEAKPFNLTQPRPRSVPLPEAIPELKRHRPVPRSTYLEPKEQDELSVVRTANRRTAEERLMSSSKTQFACAHPGKSDKTLTKMEEIREAENAKLDFNSHKANPLPASYNATVPIKLNTAAILREGRLYQRKEAEEIEKLERLEAGAKDASDFMKWQSEMRQKDIDGKLADIERRRLEGKLSHEDAILARKNLIKENKQKVAEIKEETRIRLEEYLAKRLEEEKEMKQLVEMVADGHQNAKEAKKRLTEYKAKIVQEVQGESKEILRQALEKAEEEMRRKMEIIHAIRAMEAVPVIRQKFVDLTQTAGYGLLSEMSIAELKERLALYKDAEQKAEEERRDDILASKQAKDQILMDTLEMISKHRTEKSRAMAMKFEEHKKTRNTKQEIKNEKLSELQRQLEEKKRERLREQELSKVKISKQSAVRTNTLISEKKQREYDRWAELEKTKGRAAKLSSQGAGASSSASRLLSSNRNAAIAI